MFAFTQLPDRRLCEGCLFMINDMPNWYTDDRQKLRKVFCDYGESEEYVCFDNYISWIETGRPSLDEIREMQENVRNSFDAVILSKDPVKPIIMRPRKHTDFKRTDRPIRMKRYSN